MAVKEGFEEELARMQAERTAARGALRDAFAVSPAILVIEGTHRELWILSPELDPKDGSLRVTYLTPDGPRGHFAGDDIEDLVKELSSTRARYEPVDENAVIRWTSTKAYHEGLLQVAFVQAEGQLRWIAGKRGKDAYAWAMDVRDQAYAEADKTGKIEDATRILERAAADLQAGRAPNTRALRARLINAF